MRCGRQAPFRHANAVQTRLKLPNSCSANCRAEARRCHRTSAGDRDYRRGGLGVKLYCVSSGLVLSSQISRRRRRSGAGRHKRPNGRPPAVFGTAPNAVSAPKEIAMATIATDKRADLAGPGIGDYTELERTLPSDYTSLLTRKETQKAIFAVKQYLEENLCKELNLMMVTVPLIVDCETGVNDMLDRDGSRTPIQFHISNDRDKHPVEAQIVQAATKWKRLALKQFGMKVGEGLCTDMRAVRKDYFLDHDHSCYVDQWDWERAMSAEQ